MQVVIDSIQRSSEHKDYFSSNRNKNCQRELLSRLAILTFSETARI